MTNDSDHLENLIGDHLDGVLDPQGQQELAEQLAASAEARKLLASHMRIHGGVCQLGKAGAVEDNGAGENKPTAAPRMRFVAMVASIAACLAVAVLAGYWLTSESSPPENPVIAEVLEASETTRRSGEGTIALQEGMPIYSGDAVSTTDVAVIAFPDGTIVALEEQSQVTFLLQDGAKHFDLHGGMLRLDVAAQPADKPLVVQTPRSKVIVLGTRFSIEASNDHTEVAVNEGTVRVEARDDERTFVEVTTGEIARVNKRGLTTKQMQVVYWNGKKRVHVKGCRRLTTDPRELAKLQKMTLAEAEAKGLPLCSRCPGSTTPGRGQRAKEKKKQESRKKNLP